MDKQTDARQSRLLAALPEDAPERWLPHLEPVDMPLSHVLYEPGCTLSHVYFPTSAIVQLQDRLHYRGWRVCGLPNRKRKRPAAQSRTLLSREAQLSSNRRFDRLQARRDCTSRRVEHYEGRVRFEQMAMSIDAVMPEFAGLSGAKWMAVEHCELVVALVTALHENGLHQDACAARAVLDGMAREAVH
jgi:hypothetical protein